LHVIASSAQAPGTPPGQPANAQNGDTTTKSKNDTSQEGEPHFDDPEPVVPDGRPEVPQTQPELLPYVIIAFVVVGAITFWLVRKEGTAPTETHGDSDMTSIPAVVQSASTAKVTSIFISYRREDSADISGRISDRLVEHFGRNSVFKDVDSIPIGRDFRTHLQEAVGRCDALLVIIGKQWCDSSVHGKRRLDDPRDHLRIEIESALARNIPVIPVLVQGALVPEEELLPESLRPLAYRNGVHVRPDPDFNVDLERLIRGMKSQFDTQSGAS